MDATHPCIPNPFNPMTKISYELPIRTQVNLAIYDLMGRLVQRLRSGELEEAGRHEAVWYGKDERGQSVAAGVYIYRLQAGSFVDTRRMTLLK